jgi:hypothetical protein
MLPFVKSNFTSSQAKLIYEAFRLQPVANENIRVKYYKGGLRSPPTLYLYIDNVISESAFISRINGNISERNADEYSITVLPFRDSSREFDIRLSFYGDSGKLSARLQATGVTSEEFMSVYDFMDSLYVFLFNPTNALILISLLIIEILCIIYLVKQRRISKWKQLNKQEN